MKRASLVVESTLINEITLVLRSRIQENIFVTYPPYNLSPSNTMKSAAALGF